MTVQERIGKRITELHKAKKLSQQKFAYEADIERSFLTHTEKGRKNIEIFDRIVSLLQKQTVDLINY